MQYQISGIHINVGEALQTRVQDEINNAISKYAERPTSVQVIFSKNGHKFFCEVIIHLSSGLTVQAKTSNPEIYIAFDACAEKIEKQLRRYKRKLKSYHKDRNQSVEFIGSTSYTGARKECSKDSNVSLGPVIVAETVKNFPVFSVKEAAEEIERSELPFLLFKSEENQGVNILFRREDGNMGWIEPS
tara:strand:- start:1392 stop:1955 length:564 start_codon:yes stop_codon:yes gene_type:complete